MVNIHEESLRSEFVRFGVAAMRHVLCWSVAALLLSNLPQCRLAASGANSPIVKLNSGILEGTKVGEKPSEVAFFGVPYAAPPTGELRWKPPPPAQKWNGVRKAVTFGSSCPQLPARWLQYIEGHEDCFVSEYLDH